MSRELFGTDGVRGLAGEYPLNDDGCKRIGMAVGKLFAEPGKTVIIGCDTRESSDGIVAMLSAGLNAVGVNVLSVGVITTPGLAYLTNKPDFAAGVMVTASHNPYQFNGIKVFDDSGDKLSDEVEARLNDLIESDIQPETSPGRLSKEPGLTSDYVDFLARAHDTRPLSGLSIALDTANGSASNIAPAVFERLGATVAVLSNTPNGKNINDHCGATDTTVLQQYVKTNMLDLGIAFDGDADRVIMVDELGREVKGDYLLYILAVTSHVQGVVATVMSNIGFEQALHRQGINLERTAVGDRYVLEGLEKTGYELGGEQSGHILLPKQLQTGDGILAAVQVLRAVQASEKSLAKWCDEVPLVPQAIVNIALSNKALLQTSAVEAYIQDQTAELGEAGRLLIRPSGTEPLARVMVEAPDAELRARRIADELSRMLTNAEARI